MVSPDAHITAEAPPHLVRADCRAELHAPAAVDLRGQETVADECLVLAAEGAAMLAFLRPRLKHHKMGATLLRSLTSASGLAERGPECMAVSVLEVDPMQRRRGRPPPTHLQVAGVVHPCHTEGDDALRLRHLPPQQGRGTGGGSGIDAFAAGQGCPCTPSTRFLLVAGK